MGALISLLAVTRFLFLTLPIWSYVHKTSIKRAVISYILLVHLVTTAVFIKNLTAAAFWFGPCQWAIPQGHIFLDWWINFVFYLNLGAGVLFSLLTAGWIVFKSRENEGSQAMNQSSVTIIFMNAGLVLFLSLWMFLDRDLPQSPQDHMARYVNARYNMYYIYYLISTLLPMVLAAYNPLVICVRCSDLRVRVWKKVRSLGYKFKEQSGKRGCDSARDTGTTNIFSQ